MFFCFVFQQRNYGLIYFNFKVTNPVMSVSFIIFCRRVGTEKKLKKVGSVTYVQHFIKKKSGKQDILLF